MKKRLILLLIILLGTVNIFAKEDGRNDTLIIAQRSDIKTLDPQKSIDTISYKVINMIYDTLFILDENLEIKPKLVKNWKQIDNLNLELEIKEGIKFHNGIEMTSEDVVYSLNRARKSAQVGYYFNPITDVVALDKYKVRITTEKPFGALLSNLSTAGSSIVSKKAVEESEENYAENPIGSGAYKFIEWIPGDKVTLVAFDEYHDGKVESKNVIVRNIPEVTNRTIALETGEIDVAYDIGIMDIEFIKSNNDLDLIEVEAPFCLYLGFDSTNPILADKNLRKAIAYAIDNKAIAEYVYNGSAEPGDSPVPPILNIYNPNVEKYEQNIELAKEYMKKAGHENGLSLEFWVSSQSTIVDMATIIQDQLKEINIDLKIMPYEWGAYISMTSAKNKGLYLLSWNTANMDGDQALYPLFHSGEQGTSGNRSYYSNKKVDETLMKARNTIDQKERKELYYEIQNMLQEELPHYTLVYPKYNLAIRKDVKSLKFQSNGYTDYSKVYVTK